MAAIIGGMVTTAMIWVFNELGYINLIQKKLVIGPYFSLENYLNECIEICDNEFAMITETADFLFDGERLDESTTEDLLDKMEKEAEDRTVKVLFYKNENSQWDESIIRDRMHPLLERGIEVYVYDKNIQVKAGFVTNTTSYVGVRSDYRNDVIRRVGHLDVQRLLQGYFDIAYRVDGVEIPDKTDENIEIAIKSERGKKVINI